jgi:hypothetical protein
MAQKTNLNINPYFDDFDSTKNFYKILFNPGRPIQARELTTLQSVLQDQIESFGSHIFKEGAMVIPGAITFDSQFYAVKLNSTNFGVPIDLYIDQFIGKIITGQTSGVSASIDFVAYPDGDEIENTTIYVKYLDSDNNNVFNPFLPGEQLVANENIIYGNTTINAGTPFASLISSDATTIGSSASVSDGIYFIRGTFVRVNKERIILDPYGNLPSYRVGFKVTESIVTAKDDDSLYDNAKGFSNFAAPGADRFKIAVSLTKKPLDDLNDIDFIELMRVQEGQIKKIITKTDYSIIRDYLAQRTYDESGDYSIDRFDLSVHNSLNNRLGNDGLFFDNEKTELGNTPSDDLLSVKISPGKAYVRGYDVQTLGTTILDVEKPRDTQTVGAVNVSFEMGNKIRINNFYGAPKQNAEVTFYRGRLNSSLAPAGAIVGTARIYTYNLVDAAYSNPSTEWDVYLYDVQLYTSLTITSSTTTNTTSFIRGKSSGATGYVVSGATGTTITLRQVTGTFLPGEQIIVDDNENNTRTISTASGSVISYGSDEVRAIYQAPSAGYPVGFSADTVLNNALLPGFGLGELVTITNTGTVRTPGKLFSNIKPSSVLRYRIAGLATETYNVVSSVNSDGLSFTVAAGAAVTGVCNGALPSSTVTVQAFIGNSQIANSENASLYTVLPSANVASVDLSGSDLIISEQITGQSTDGSGILSFLISAVGITSAFFEAFDEDRYSVHYADGSQARITSDQFTTNGTSVTIRSLRSSQSNVVVNITAKKIDVQSKVKEFVRSEIVYIRNSKFVGSGTTTNTSLNDGLTYSPYYGTRVQDQSICVNYPDAVKVLAVYESLSAADPTLDRLTFSVTANVDTNAIIGENIIGTQSGSIARVVARPSANTLSIVYLNPERFQSEETVRFTESNIVTEIDTIILGEYLDLTNNFSLDKGQREQYLDYSRIVRNSGAIEPNKRLIVIFDRYQVPDNDNGDVFTVLSYGEERYGTDLPDIGPNRISASDVLDFRPRVAPFTSTSASPFDFSQRSFVDDPKYIIAPGESSVVGYSFYLGRIDRVYIDKFGTVTLDKGVSSVNPEPPTKPDEVMNIGTITLPPYLRDTRSARISLTDNRRFTMRDIGGLQDRIRRLEELTSLTLLELSTQTLQIQDAQGLNRFKTGFFVDDFKNDNLIDFQISRCEVDFDNEELTPITSRNSLRLLLAPAAAQTDEQIDISSNYTLIDSNVKKTGPSVTLNYREVDWVEQPIATRVENVNPFHVVEYSGTITLNPSEDTWVRTVQLPDRVIAQTTTRVDFETQVQTFRRTVGNPRRRGTTEVTTQSSQRTESGGSFATEQSQQTLENTINDEFVRMRNVEFRVQNLKPYTRYYQFLDGNSGVDIIPKLVEITSDPELTTSGASKAFIPGETVLGGILVGGSPGRGRISFRVASPNHKNGPFNNPTTKYTTNPYNKAENLPTEYSASSSVLNVDTFALAEEAQGLFFGRLEVGMRLVGQTSGAVAYVKAVRLVTDNVGFVGGCFWIREPYQTPPPPVRIGTGTKTYKLSSDQNNTKNVPGSTIISSAETTYRAEGTVNFFRRIITRTTTNIVRVITDVRRTETTFNDPLAQSFTVGASIDAPGPNNFQEDINGAFITGADLYFRTKDKGNSTLTIQIRTMELGTPTRTVLGDPIVLTPDQVNVSEDASVPTRVTFNYPIYLPPGQEYAIVLLAPESDQYEAWIAQMGEASINAASLPNADQARYTQQFAIGSLFKSQNGSIWTADQYQDLKFKLYKAEFTSTQGTSFFYNPTLNESNGYVETLPQNPITTFPRELRVGITTSTNTTLAAILTPGRRVTTNGFSSGVIAGTGSSVSTVSITGVGTNYVTDANVDTYNISGRGTGLRLGITATNGIITGISTVFHGNGYSVGDVVGIVTSSVSSNTGSGALFTISQTTGIDTLYLTNVQGQGLNVGVALTYFTETGQVSMASTVVTSSTPIGGRLSGNYMRVDHFDHGMYADNNKLQISDVQSNIAPVLLAAPLAISDTVINVAVGDTTNFTTFEGVQVSSSNPGYLLVENEIIRYGGVGQGTINTLTRGQDSTLPLDYSVGALIYKYELDGVSLRRINTTHDISDFDNQSDSYYIEIDRSTGGLNRTNDGAIPNSPQLSFRTGGTFGGFDAKSSRNILFDSILPLFSILTPGPQTTTIGRIRTVTATSIDGTEVSFQDVGFEPVLLNQVNKLSSLRMVTSKVNEQAYLSGLPRNKSFTTAITLSTSDKNISPQIFVDRGAIEFRSSRINSPIANYANDSRINTIIDDPHTAVYYTSIIPITQPATSIKLLVTAYIPSGSDIRALYSLDPVDTPVSESIFTLFPGWDNLTVDTNGDGIPDGVVNSSLNSGRPDVQVPFSLNNEYREYQFTAERIPQFTAYSVKIVLASTNQADAPRIRDVRVITIR